MWHSHPDNRKIWLKRRFPVQALRAAPHRAIIEAALALTCYLALALLVTWPLALRFGAELFGGIDHVPGRFRYAGAEEAGLHLWHLWWVSEAIRRGANPFWTDRLFYPDGVQLYVQTLSAPNAIITLPVYLLAGPVAAFNAVIVLGFALTGFGVFLLARQYAGGFWGPLLCGTLITLGPFHLGQLQNSHNHLFSMQWIPLYMHALTLLDERGGRWRIGYASGTAALVALSDWYWATVCGTLTIVWMITRLALAQEWRALMRRYAFFVAGALLALAPFVAGMIAIWRFLPIGHHARDMVWEAYVRYSSADLFGLLLPTVYNPLWGTQVEQMLRPIAEPFAPSVWYVAAGWTLMILAITGIWLAENRAVHLLIIAGCLWVLALGPTLWVLGRDSGIPMPYAWLDRLPLFGAARKPGLFIAPVLVILSVLAALGLAALQRRLPSAWRAAPVAAAAVLGAFELWLPSGRVFLPLERPAVYEQIAARPGAVADLPLDILETSRTLRNQMIHGQPIIGGFIARRPAYQSFDIPLLRAIGLMQALPDNDIVPLRRADLMAMQCFAPVRHVVIRTDLTTQREQKNLEQTLARLTGHPVVPAYADAQYRWYELPLFPDACHPFVYLGKGWHAVERNAEMTLYRWADAESQVIIANPHPGSSPALVSFRLAAYQTTQHIEVWRDRSRLGSWDVSPAPRTYRLLLPIEARINQFTLRAPAAPDPQSNRMISIVAFHVSVEYLEPPERK
ncbi:MAG: hypothetical protein RMJ48_00660 [Roseiflexaceae bacterium]|nr:hypothetical protein [Roseiflexaceae bacterium]